MSTIIGQNSNGPTASALAAENSIDHAVMAVLESTKGYVSLSGLSRLSGASPDLIQSFVMNHPEKVRTSILRDETGGEVYLLNTKFSGIKDAWNAFRYINSKKY